MKSMMQVLVVVVGMMSLVMLAGVGCQDDGGPTGSTARAVECADDGTCPGGEPCVRGYCMPECATDADCPAGVCVAGVCEFEPAPWACAADSDCPAGTSCEAGSCVAAPATCTPAAEVCNGLDDDCDGVVDNGLSCPTPCTSDDDCDDGLFCTSAASCVAGSCVVLPGIVCDGGDPANIDDCDEAADTCTHDACVPTPEICGNRLDDDCDGMVDETPDCTCETGETLCGSVCVDLLFDDMNCGTCGSACPGGQSCERGTCTA